MQVYKIYFRFCGKWRMILLCNFVYFLLFDEYSAWTVYNWKKSIGLSLLHCCLLSFLDQTPLTLGYKLIFFIINGHMVHQYFNNVFSVDSNIILRRKQNTNHSFCSLVLCMLNKCHSVYHERITIGGQALRSDRERYGIGWWMQLSVI